MSIKESMPYQKLRECIRLWQDKNLKQSLQENVTLKDTHKGETCYILGNGPSLKNIDFSLLADKFTMTVNQLPRNPRFPELKSNIHMWSDGRFFDLHENRPEDMELLEVMKAVNTDNNHPLVFYSYAGRKMIEHFSLDQILNVRYFEQGYYYISPDVDVDMTKFTPAFSSVVHYLICLAVYMGFKKIILLGCDCTSIATIVDNFLNKGDQAQYAYAISDNEKKRMEEVQQKNTVRNELVSTLRLFDDYQRVYKYCQKRGVQLLNASDPTLLDVVPKVKFEDTI